MNTEGFIIGAENNENNNTAPLTIDGAGTVKNIPLDTPISESEDVSSQNEISLDNYTEKIHTVKTDSVVTPDNKRIYGEGAAYDRESGQWMETQNSKEAPETATYITAEEKTEPAITPESASRQATLRHFRNQDTTALRPGESIPTSTPQREPEWDPNAPGHYGLKGEDLINEGVEVITEESVGQTEVPPEAEAFLGLPLTTEEQEEYEQAGKSLKDFFGTVKRAFNKSGGWKRLISSVGASAVGAAAIAGVGTVVAAPVIATGAAALMIGTGATYIIKAHQMLKEQGLTLKEAWQDKAARRGLIEGLAAGAGTKGIGLALRLANPALGIAAPAFSFLAETGIHVASEVRLNKQRENLLNTYLTEYSKRQYAEIVDNEYTIARPDGETTLNVEQIITDARDAEYEGQKRTATKVAMSTLRYLAQATNYQNPEFNISCAINQGGTIQNVQHNILDPDLNINRMNLNAIPEADLNRMLEAIETTWNNLPSDMRVDAAKHVIREYAAIESIDVERIVSQERSMYLDNVKRVTAMRASMMFVNGTTAVIGGSVNLAKSVGTIIENQQATSQPAPVSEQARQQYAQQFKDTDATFTEAADNTVGADLDNDGDVDVWFKNGRYYPQTTEGVEKAFELEHNTPISEINEITPSGDSNITGILRDPNGNAAGITYMDNNGNTGILTNEELGQALTIDGNNVTIGNINTNGLASVTVGGNSYAVNLANLSDIPGTAETLISDPLDMTIQEGDSMNRAVQNLVNKLNTEYGTNIDQLQAEREIAMGLSERGMLADQQLRTTVLENGGNGAVIDPGDIVKFRGSEEAMRILERLNTGNPIPPSVSTINATPGLPVSFASANVATINPAPITAEAIDTVTNPFATILSAFGLVGIAGREEKHDLTNKYQASYIPIGETQEVAPEPTPTSAPGLPSGEIPEPTPEPEPTIYGLPSGEPTETTPESGSNVPSIKEAFFNKVNDLPEDIRAKITNGNNLTDLEKITIREIFLNPETNQIDNLRDLQRQLHPDLAGGDDEGIKILNNVIAATRN